MCGVAGVIGPVAETAKSGVDAMMNAQTHRGPDDSGTYISGTQAGVTLGFRRLAIIDLSRDGHQPMIDRERGTAVVFNGEIYNYADLRRELQDQGATFASKSDTEVLLKAYARWGPEVVTRLRGMFAFAVYDARRREVLIARDRLGIKPLYYGACTVDGEPAMAFASELRALLATGFFPRHIDPDGLASYVWNGFVVGPNTMVRGISLLPPGTILRVPVDRPVATPMQYWVLPRGRPLAEAEAVEHLSDELRTATRQHLASDVPLGVFLSGGVDSSAVAALAVAEHTGRVKTFNVAFDETEFDESRYARRVARALGTEHLELRLTQSLFRSQLDDALRALDQPTFDALNTYFVSRAVRESGCTVALAGTGGDELFGGYPTFRLLPRLQLPARAASRASAAFRLALAMYTRVHGRGGTPPQSGWGKTSDVLETRGDLFQLYQVARSLFSKDLQAQLVSSGHVLANGLAANRARELTELCQRRRTLEAISALELSMFVGERLLRDTDTASMAVSLEVRVPLLDHRVVEALQAVPTGTRFHPLGTKRLLKRVAIGSLDPSQFNRAKSGFVVPIERWARADLAEEIGQVLSNGTLVEGAGLAHEPIRRLWEAFRSGAPGVSWARVWAPYVLVGWCRDHNVSIA